jgi:hypothetical protein
LSQLDGPLADHSPPVKAARGWRRLDDDSQDRAGDADVETVRIAGGCPRSWRTAIAAKIANGRRTPRISGRCVA